MPLVGLRDLSLLHDEAPAVTRLATDAVELQGVTVVQLLFELEHESVVTLLPPALHPTIPPTLFIGLMKAPVSPWGPFTMAEVRLGCRSGARPRALLLRAVCDSDSASEAVRSQWGFPVVNGQVSLDRHYDREQITVSTSIDGRILDAAMVNPEPVGGTDINFTYSLHPARIDRGTGEVLRLVQVDTAFSVGKADRGRPVLKSWRPEAWRLAGASAGRPVAAFSAEAVVTLPAIRYLIDPDSPPLRAVERVQD